MTRLLKITIVLLLLAVVWLPTHAGATNSYRDAWLSQYSTACQTLKSAASSCTLCHVDPPDLNPYGDGLIGHRSNMSVTNNEDADGDGKSNIVEIAACFLPGDPASKPVPNEEHTWGLIKGLYR